MENWSPDVEFLTTKLIEIFNFTELMLHSPVNAKLKFCFNIKIFCSGAFKLIDSVFYFPEENRKYRAI
jgi:hypothetical protein